MIERTGKTTKFTAVEGVVLHERTNGSFEVVRDGVTLGYVGKYTSTTEVKPGKVRASERRKPVTRWNASPLKARSSYGLTSRKAAVERLLADSTTA